MKQPFVLTWTIPKFKGIVMISFEKLPNFLGNGQSLDLIWINRQIKDFFHYINEVSDNNYVFDIG